MNAFNPIHMKLTWKQKQTLAREALGAANNLRMRRGYDLFAPVCPIGFAEDLGMKVRFIPGGLEGAYLPGDTNRILISSDRPLRRRRFTCAHEIGHHEFGHGASLDELRDEMGTYLGRDPKEFMADSFAGHFLMPVMGLEAAFSKRDAIASSATIEIMGAIATEFGVGFDTLLAQLAFTLQEISQDRRQHLLKEKFAFQRSILQKRKGGNLIIIDKHSNLETLDVDVGCKIFAPAGTEMCGGSFESQSIHGGLLFEALQRGYSELNLLERSTPTILRIEPKNFIGLSENRYLEDDDEY